MTFMFVRAGTRLWSHRHHVRKMIKRFLRKYHPEVFPFRSILKETAFVQGMSRLNIVILVNLDELSPNFFLVANFIHVLKRQHVSTILLEPYPNYNIQNYSLLKLYSLFNFYHIYEAGHQYFKRHNDRSYRTFYKHQSGSLPRYATVRGIKRCQAIIKFNESSKNNTIVATAGRFHCSRATVNRIKRDYKNGTIARDTIILGCNLCRFASNHSLEAAAVKSRCGIPDLRKFIRGSIRAINSLLKTQPAEAVAKKFNLPLNMVKFIGTFK